jgi:hypothetical protein
MRFLTYVRSLNKFQMGVLLRCALNAFEDAVESGDIEVTYEAAHYLYVILDEYENRNIPIPAYMPTGLVDRLV